MIDANIMKELRKFIDKISAYQGKELARREDWGKINFDEVKSDLQTVISLSVALGELPIQYLSDNSAQSIVNVMQEFLPQIEALDKFSITDGDPNQRRMRLISDIHRNCDRFYGQVGVWIPFLAYQKGDVSENIKRLTSAIVETEKKADDGLKRIAGKEKDIEEIVVRAREASAGAGVAVFTKDFENESNNAANSAGRWLKATVAFAALTLAIPAYVYFFEDSLPTDKGQLISKLASKVVAISILFTATMWCGKIYKSMRHLSILNRHRAIGIRTFRAFSAAASDARTKDAVLMETTHSIFSNSATGLINDPANDAEPNIIQIAGKVMDNANGK